MNNSSTWKGWYENLSKTRRFYQITYWYTVIKNCLIKRNVLTTKNKRAFFSADTSCHEFAKSKRWCSVKAVIKLCFSARQHDNERLCFKTENKWKKHSKINLDTRTQWIDLKDSPLPLIPSTSSPSFQNKLEWCYLRDRVDCIMWMDDWSTLLHKT